VGAIKDNNTFIELNNMPLGSYGPFTDKSAFPGFSKGEERITRLRI
jgi:hypothetical protein